MCRVWAAWVPLEALRENLVHTSLLAPGGGRPSSVLLDLQTHESRLHLCLGVIVLPLCVYVCVSLWGYQSYYIRPPRPV